MYTTGSNDIVVKERLFDSHLDFGVSDAYNVGLNADNEIIFKDKNAALKQIYTDYKDGFEYLRKQSPVSYTHLIPSASQCGCLPYPSDTLPYRNCRCV